MNPERKYVIVSNEHDRWPRGALLFWGRLTDDEKERSFGGYTTKWDKCEKYTREELEKWRGSLFLYYPFFDELEIQNDRDFRRHSEVLCTMEDLESLGYSLWNVMCLA